MKQKRIVANLVYLALDMKCVVVVCFIIGGGILIYGIVTYFGRGKVE